MTDAPAEPPTEIITFELEAPAAFVRSRPAPPPVPIVVTEETEAAPDDDTEDANAGDIGHEKMVKKFNRERKANVIIRADALPLVNHISTGIFALDLALLGGFCENSPFMIYGLESSAKTTLMLKVVASFQQKYPDKMCGWVDAEMSFDRIWAEKNGVDLSRLLFCQPESGEEGVDAIETMLTTSDISFVAADSVPAFVPIAIQDRSAEDKTYGGNAALIGTMMSKVLTATGAGRRRGHRPTFGVVNQIRDSMVMKGSPYKIPGGKQLRYQTTTWVRMKGSKKLAKDAFGCEIADYIQQAFVIEKSKCGSSLNAGEYRMSLNPLHCLDKSLPDGARIEMSQVYEAATVMSQAKRMGLITGGGGNWRLSGVDQGFSKGADMEAYLYANPEEDRRIRRTIIGVYRRQNKLPALPPDGYLLGW